MYDVILVCRGFFVRLDQCVFGALAKKPTQLMTQCSRLRNMIAAHRRGGFCCHPAGHPPAIGLKRDGFRTTPLAAYPRAFATVLAVAAAAAAGDGRQHGRSLAFAPEPWPEQLAWQARAEAAWDIAPWKHEVLRGGAQQFQM